MLVAGIEIDTESGLLALLRDDYYSEAANTLEAALGSTNAESYLSLTRPCSSM